MEHIEPYWVGIIVFIFAFFKWWLTERDKASKAASSHETLIKLSEANSKRIEELFNQKLSTLETRVPEITELQIRKFQEVLFDKLGNGLGTMITRNVTLQVENLRQDFEGFMATYKSGIRHAVTEAFSKHQQN
jgi:Fe-S cluster assembly ATPase SufC